jgi:class 3 adenylate cyclase
VGNSGELTDFTALGDAVNITERLSSAAAARELLISDAAVTASGYSTAGLSKRDLNLKGVAQPVQAWSQLVTASAPAATGGF